MKIKAFTLLELLVVIALLGVFSAIAYPNISNWITDREVKSEAYEFVAEINFPSRDLLPTVVWRQRGNCHVAYPGCTRRTPRVIFRFAATSAF